uniref:Cytochrome b6-f complex subunit PetP n=1 Tax=Schizymenia dubyi TaxID=38368 RepID=A0A1C9C947_9FLOR|nr:hypothetical protein Schiz_009 [Schizymenia dubyi]AOM64892.1 hypothetical protein Schiz_009 [Schizymenia dubyi]
MSKKSVKIIKMDSKINYHIQHYLYLYGVIIGKKTINFEDEVPIIQFNNQTRVWIKNSELQYL